MRFTRAALILAAIAGTLALAPAAASAAPAANCHRVHQQSGNNYGLLNGNNLYAPLGLDLDLSHNALGLLGYGHAEGDDLTAIDCGN